MQLLRTYLLFCIDKGHSLSVFPAQVHCVFLRLVEFTEAGHKDTEGGV
jgi:hypothetical protein